MASAASARQAAVAEHPQKEPCRPSHLDVELARAGCRHGHQRRHQLHAPRSVQHHTHGRLPQQLAQGVHRCGHAASGVAGPPQLRAQPVNEGCHRFLHLVRRCRRRRGAGGSCRRRGRSAWPRDHQTCLVWPAGHHRGQQKARLLLQGSGNGAAGSSVERATACCATRHPPPYATTTHRAVCSCKTMHHSASQPAKMCRHPPG